MDDTSKRALQRPVMPGFTLVELLIALVIAVLLTSALVSLVRAQNQYGMNAMDQVEAEQALRAAVDLASSELRMAGSGDLISARRDRVAIRFDVSRAIVCDVTGPDEVALFVYDSVPDANVGTGYTGTAWTEPGERDFAYADGWLGSEPLGAVDARATCTESGATMIAADDAYRIVAGWLGAFSGQLPGRGSLVRRYGRLTYRFGPASLGSGWALWRGSQELVSSLSPGARFIYRLGDGSEVEDVADDRLADVREIRLIARASGRRATHTSSGRSVAYGTPLRN